MEDGISKMKFPVSLLTKLASKSHHPRFYHSSIVVRGGAIISQGYNHDKIHSEIDALTNLWPNRRAGSTIINLRINRSGGFANSRPCRECYDFLIANGIKRIYYTNKIGIFEEMK